MAKTKQTDDKPTGDKAMAVKPTGDKTKPADKPKPGTNPTPVHIGGDSIADRLMPHVKKIAVGAGVIALILTAVFGVRWWRERARGKKTVVLSHAMDVLRREVMTPDPTEKPDPTKPKDPTFATYKDRADAGLVALAKGGGDMVGDVYRGGLLLDSGKLDDAERAYRKASTHQGLDGVLAREGLGFVAEARAVAAKDNATESQHQYEAALAAFQAEQPDDKGPLRDHALYHSARMMIQLQKTTEAVAALQKALEVAPESDLEPEINERLADLGAEPK